MLAPRTEVRELKYFRKPCSLGPDRAAVLDSLPRNGKTAPPRPFSAKEPKADHRCGPKPMAAQLASVPPRFPPRCVPNATCKGWRGARNGGGKRGGGTERSFPSALEAPPGPP